jgi:hypothetical protein
MYKIPEKYRAQLNTEHAYYSDRGEMSGLFLIPTAMKNVFLMCIASNGNEEVQWEHVSVSLKKMLKGGTAHELGRCPTWEEMCKVKDLFWDGTDTVVQFHPPESEYVSEHHHCLHLWRKRNENFETPPSIAVGNRIGQNLNG